MGDRARSDQRPLGLVITGGTIGSEVKDGVADVGATPELDLLRVTANEVPNIGMVAPVQKLSENMQPDDWLTIAQSVRDLVEKSHADSVLILHGTDTMTFTASALSFLLADLKVPVVLTGGNLQQKGLVDEIAKFITNLFFGWVSSASRWVYGVIYAFLRLGALVIGDVFAFLALQNNHPATVGDPRPVFAAITAGLTGSGLVAILEERAQEKPEAKQAEAASESGEATFRAGEDPPVA